MDRPGVPQVPEGCGEQGKMERTGCKIICGAPTTFAVKGLMMMMMMMMMTSTKQLQMVRLPCRGVARRIAQDGEARKDLMKELQTADLTWTRPEEHYPNSYKWLDCRAEAWPEE